MAEPFAGASPSGDPDWRILWIREGQIAEEADRHFARAVRSSVMIPLGPGLELLPPVVDLQLPGAFAAPAGRIWCLGFVRAWGSNTPTSHL